LPDGESLRQFRNRSARFVRRVDAAHLHEPDANVLVVAHGGQLAVLLTVLLGMRARDRFSFRFGNCSITLLSRSALNTTLDVHNYIVWGDAATVFSDRGLSGQLPQRAE
jgi:broad specificity phosphatase PhoE